MENITYEAYRSNPAIREQLEREAHAARAAEVQRLMVAPLLSWVAQAFARQPKAPRVSSQSASSPA